MAAISNNLRYIKQVSNNDPSKIEQLNNMENEIKERKRNSVLINGKELVNPNGTINLNVFLEDQSPSQNIDTLDE